MSLRTYLHSQRCTSVHFLQLMICGVRGPLWQQPVELTLYCINILLPIIYTSRWEITYSAPAKEAKCWLLLPGLVHR